MKAIDFLAGLYESDPRTGKASVDSTPAVPEPEPMPSDLGQPDKQPAAEAEHPLDRWLAAEDFSRWRYVPGLGYLGPDSDEAEDFDSLPEPCPCPACGSLDWWEDIRGGRHCAQCEGSKLARSRRLADRAERLRKRAPVGKPASTVAQGCEETVADDTQHVDSPSPSAAALEPLGGREDG